MEQFEKIQQLIKQIQPSFTTIVKPVEESLGHVLQQSIKADMDMPPFHKSAVDGYACRRADLGNKLKIIEVIPAGSYPKHKIETNQCSKIMTGAAVPENADCVFMVEDAEMVDNEHVICKNTNTNTNICYRGEDFKEGDILIEKGEIIRAEHTAVIAGAGMDNIQVSAMPRVGLIVNGSELVKHTEKPGIGKIRNTNGLQLRNLCKRMFLTVQDFGIVKDDESVLISTFEKALEENDIIIFTGGASVGDYDFVPKIFEKLGFQILWNRTGLKPGNPMSFSYKKNKYCFGLSGNPVSCLVQFEYIVKPVIYHLLGSNYKPLVIKGEMIHSFERKKASRFGVLPVKINNEGLIEILPFNGSAHISALVNANALMEIPNGITKINKGEKAHVRPL